MHAIFGLRLSYAIVQNTNIFLHRQTVDIRQLMLNPYEVIRAAPWLRDEVDMVFLCVHKDLYGLAPLFSPARSFSLTSIQLAKMVMNPWHFFLEKTTATPKTWTIWTRTKSLKMVSWQLSLSQIPMCFISKDSFKCWPGLWHNPPVTDLFGFIELAPCI